MRARDYFEDIRAEIEDIGRTRRMLAAMAEREGVHAQGFAPAHSGGDADAMGAVDARMDLEARLQDRVEQSHAAIAEACEILYGRDNRGGLAKARGSRYADAVCMAYLQAEPMVDVAEVMRCSPKWCRTLCNEAFSYIDDVGMAALREF